MHDYFGKHVRRAWHAIGRKAAAQAAHIGMLGGKPRSTPGSTPRGTPETLFTAVLEKGRRIAGAHAVRMGVACALGASVLCAPSVFAATALPPTTVISGGLLGNVVLARPAGPIRAFVVLYSGREGWTAGDQQAAEAMARDGAMVVGVDTPAYAAKLALTRQNKAGCHYLVDDAEALSHQLQREAHSSRYFLPILAGVGQGALLAERSLARAPANTLSGALAFEPETTLDPRFNPCVPDPTITHVKGYPGFLETGDTDPNGAARSALPSQGGGYHRFEKGTSEADAMRVMLKPHLLANLDGDDEDVSDLPLIELPTAQPSDMLAIVISGDGGWRDLDKTIAESLQREGVPVVGIDALRYFWSEKTPAQTSHDVARVIQAYGARWHAKHVALIGYSFGADVMPFVYNRLPDNVKAKVSQISLLGFAAKADFQIRVTGWLGMPASSAALDAFPETAKIPPILMQCFYGVDDDDTACPALGKQDGVSLVKTSGGHHFGRDYDALAQSIITRWRAQIDTDAGK